MILDAIFSLVFLLFGILLDAVTIVFSPLINLIAIIIETVIGIFVSGFSLGRIKREKSEKASIASTIVSSVIMLAIFGLISWFVIAPKIMNRKVTLVAADGHSLPFAALIIHTESGEQHQRTDSSGNLVIPRFATTSITVKDPRYVEKTWPKSAIESKLVVGRSVLGSGLDSLADKLLKPAKETTKQGL